MTAKEAAALSGRSITWLKTHTCAWCDQTYLRTLMHGCAAMHEKCDPAAKSYGPETKASA
jgi:hypothetical protein